MPQSVESERTSDLGLLKCTIQSLSDVDTPVRAGKTVAVSGLVLPKIIVFSPEKRSGYEEGQSLFGSRIVTPISETASSTLLLNPSEFDLIAVGANIGP